MTTFYEAKFIKINPDLYIIFKGLSNRDNCSFIKFDYYANIKK